MGTLQLIMTGTASASALLLFFTGTYLLGLHVDHKRAWIAQQATASGAFIGYYGAAAHDRDSVVRVGK